MGYILLGFILGIIFMLLVWQWALWKETSAAEKESTQLEQQTPLDWTIEKIVQANGTTKFSCNHIYVGKYTSYYVELADYLRKNVGITEESALAKLKWLQDEYRENLVVSKTFIPTVRKE